MQLLKRGFVRLGVGTSAAALLIAGGIQSPAYADGGKCGLYAGNCTVTASKPAQPAKPRSSGGGSSRGGGSDSQSTGNATTSNRSGGSDGGAWARVILQAKRDAANYRRQLTAYESCVSQAGAGCTAPTAPGLPATGTGPAAPDDAAAPAPAVPVITPAEAGAIAVAQLQLPLNTPGIGPDPSVNKWKMAAVGYPLWLWSNGPSALGPVGQNVAGISVSLRAEVTRTVFRMGDGTSVTCTGAGTRYLSSTKPGTKSPNCGHTYSTPSLPRGKYTVTAVTNWAVTWTANGVSGVINVPREANTTLPVGELQSLVR